MYATVFIPKEGCHYVAVRPEHVSAVTEFIASLGAGRTVDAVESTDDPLITDELLADIAAGSSTSTTIVGEVMDILSAQPGTPENLVTLAERTGRELTQMQTVWTHLSRHLRKKFGHKTWPIRVRSGYRFSPPLGGEELYYWVTPTIAERWQAIRAS